MSFKNIRVGRKTHSYVFKTVEGEDRIKHYLGYKVIEDLRIKGYFHHIGFDFKPDNRLYCILVVKVKKQWVEPTIDDKISGE